MFNVLQARGIPSKLVMFPDENHVSTTNLNSHLLVDMLTVTVGAEARELAGVAQGGAGLD